MIGLFGLGIAAGAMITLQSVLNSSLGVRAGVLGSVLLLTFVSIAVLTVLIFLFPGTAEFRRLPSLSQWYLYTGGVLGVVILAVPIFLIPKIGAAVSLTAILVGQLGFAVIVDHFGLLAALKVEASIIRIVFYACSHNRVVCGGNDYTKSLSPNYPCSPRICGTCSPIWIA